MAHKKQAGAVGRYDKRDGRRLGVKVGDGGKVNAGGIIERQVGNRHHAGKNVGTGKDFTLYALIDGRVSYRRGEKKGRGKARYLYVDVIPIAQG